MPHPLVDQFRFTRHEWLRGLAGVSEDEAGRRLAAMNSIGWIVGHLAWHEHRYWLELAQGQMHYPKLNDLYAYGAPASTPGLAEMLAIWQNVTSLADPFLDTLTSTTLLAELLRNGKPVGQTVGSTLRRITYHYWFHTGEVQAIRQMLGHTMLPEYVGDLESEAPYVPEPQAAAATVD